MEDVEDAAAALERLGDDGHKALRLCVAMLRERLADATLRAERAEWLADRLREWAAKRDLTFDLSRAATHWERTRPLLADWYETYVEAWRDGAAERIAELEAEARRLRDELDDVLDSREQAEIRAEAAEKELRKARSQRE